MLLRLPRSLHYPVTVTKVLKQAGAAVSKNEAVFLYSYETTVREGSRDGDDRYVKKPFPATFESVLEGQLKFWKVKEGDVLAQPIDVAEIEEACPHSEQFAGMCTNCGKDMTIVSSFNSDANDVDRAPFQTSHDTQMLKISQREASRREEEAKRRLLASRKLSLVVDLDQTIIHAAVDPTIAEWQKDEQNPNHHVVKDVRAFQLIDDTPGMRGCWYYIKLRPDLANFLERICQLYELHIYTMGTRQYAEQVANIVDPDRRFFGDRILSRDESGSATNKNLERLFPIDTKMVVIIDDRGDVWKWNPNLIRVVPFDFFVGIGDINSSFLPKKEEINTPPAIAEDQDDAQRQGTDTKNGQSAEKAAETMENGASPPAEGTDTSALEQLVAMGGGDDPVVREIQSKGQEETIAAQLEEKPLLQKQKLLDARDEAEAATTTTTAETTESDGGEEGGGLVNGSGRESNAESESSSSASESAESTPIPAARPVPVRHSLLRDDDVELTALATRLIAVHTAFYHEYDRRRLGHKGGRVAALSGKRKIQLQQASDPVTSSEEAAASDLLLVPDVKTVMPAIKHRVLAGKVIVFSGVLPLGSNVQTADISLWAKSFGALIVERVSKQTTHVVATRSGTSKVKQASRKGLWVVGLQWLLDCMTGWKRLKEDEYVLPDLPSRIKAGSKIQDGSAEKGGNGEGLADGEKKDLFDDDPRDLFLSSDDETTGVDTEAETDDNKNGSGSKSSRKRNAVDDADGRKRLKLYTSLPSQNSGRATQEDGDGNATADPHGYLDNASPLSLNQDQWEDMDKELKEFMGSSGSGSSSSSGNGSDDDVDSSKLDSDPETRSRIDKRRNKRKRRRGEDDDGEVTTSPPYPPAAKQVDDKPANPSPAHISAPTSEAIDDDADDSQIQTEQSMGEEAKADAVGPAEEMAGPSEASSDDDLARELDKEFERGGDDPGPDHDHDSGAGAGDAGPLGGRDTTRDPAGEVAAGIVILDR